ncbi:cysteine hydrolase family protein [Usitatibacter palustris]|uniref:Streptothricin hydrolase n=1 Tax=Usitatibacter palustris TaxID=2732487 RepID=A0A6M4H5I2_9PROT|nr:cysteine hydrolase family protein [Usitatibacter palustris]QJR14552.1 Streptothricin hydrolase [Usitatibacter palustris]
MKSALVIIDMQRALCVGEWAMADVDRVIERINTLSARARAASIPVFLVQHEEGEGPLRFAAEGWQLADTLAIAPGDHRVRKTTPNSFHDTDLHEMLQERGVERLVVCGLQSDFCVDTTVRQALALGYEVALPSDAHATMDNGVLKAAQIVAHHNATLANMTSFGPRVAVVPATEVKMEAS